ncbi:MAG TPA: thiamine pyrophosphate-binding protein [Polyangiaceae bacterium]
MPPPSLARAVTMLSAAPEREANANTETVPAIHALLEILEREGVEYIFGVPGGPLTALFEALQERAKIRLVLAKHEGGAAFMAASYARASRRLAVCCGTSGPGATNALTGVASAHADSLPLLFLSGQVGTGVFGKGAIQESSTFGLDLVTLLRPVTKLSAMFTNPERIPDLLRAAIRAATSGRQGAVHLNMPADMLRQPVRSRPLRAARDQPSAVLDSAAIQRAAVELRKAKRPCLLAGHGVALAGAEAQLLELAHAARIPVMTSPKGKGVFPENDPLSLGVLGFGGHERAENYLQSGAIDLLIVVGSSLNEFVTNAWTLPITGSHQLVQVDIDPMMLNKNYPLDVPIVGDARVALAELIALASSSEARDFGPFNEVLESTPRYLAAAAIDSDAVPLKPQRLMKELREAMPDDAPLFVDNGTSIIWGVHYFEIRSPRTFFVDLGLASMGAAVAGVVGGALGAPGRHAVALVGDAAFAMNGFEVHTAVDERLPIIWVVLNNNGHGMVRQGDQLMRGRDLGASQFKFPLDSAGVAHALGARGERVTTPAELRQALAEAHAHSGPTVIDVLIDREEVAPTLARRVQTLASFMATKRPSEIRSLIGG